MAKQVFSGINAHEDCLKRIKEILVNPKLKYVSRGSFKDPNSLNKYWIEYTPIK